MQKDNSLRPPAPGGLPESTVTTFEVGHEVGQRLDAGQRLVREIIPRRGDRDARRIENVV